MEENVLSPEHLRTFGDYLIREEKSAATRQKYMRDVRRFYIFADTRPITRELLIAYKTDCIEQGYAIRSINSMLASVNSLLAFLGWEACRVKNLRSQRQTYCAEEKELTKAEYMRLLAASQKQTRLNLVLQTICSTGIRVSELRYFTVEAVRRGEITVQCKSKVRTVLLPGKLRKMLLAYAEKAQLKTGAIFVTRSGAPLDRCNIWTQMKRLCAAAGVSPTKVFPHNLRKLFARSFYSMEKDIAKLADILGHSNIETTRIYIMSTGIEHRRKIERLGLLPEIQKNTT